VDISGHCEGSLKVGLLEQADGLVADDIDQQRHDRRHLAQHRHLVQLLVVGQIALGIPLYAQRQSA